MCCWCRYKRIQRARKAQTNRRRRHTICALRLHRHLYVKELTVHVDIDITQQRRAQSIFSIMLVFFWVRLFVSVSQRMHAWQTQQKGHDIRRGDAASDE